MKKIALLATGGTIAGISRGGGYQAALLSAEELIKDLPKLPLAVATKQVLALDSRDMTPQHMLKLAHEVMICLGDPSIKGVVVSHGTDTLEESAFFLSQLLPVVKPVVFTAAMRPADSLSADGPMNLYQALLVAANEQTPAGSIAVLNDIIYCASTLCKAGASHLAAFQGQMVGQVEQDMPRFYRLPWQGGPAFALDKVNQLAEAPLLYAYAGMPAALLRNLLRADYPGLVLAAAGNASVSEALYPLLRQAKDNGTAIVLASRTGGGYVDAHDGHFISAGWFTPLQARIMLQLALSCGLDEAGLRQVFLHH